MGIVPKEYEEARQRDIDEFRKAFHKYAKARQGVFDALEWAVQFTKESVEEDD